MAAAAALMGILILGALPGAASAATLPGTCTIDASVSLSPDVAYRGNPFGENSHYPDPTGTYSGSGSGTCTVVDSATHSTRSYSASLSLSGSYHGTTCPQPLDLTGSTTFTPGDGSSAYTAATVLNVESAETGTTSEASAKFDGKPSPPKLKVQWNDYPCTTSGIFHLGNIPGPSGLRFTGNIVAPALPAGKRRVVRLTTPLSGAEQSETTPGDPDGTGFATLDFYPDEAQVCYTISFANINASPAMLGHIHKAPRGQVQFAFPVQFEHASSMSPASGCRPIDPLNLGDVLANPSNWYVQFHNTEYPEGVIRGQLGD
ncbi:MAG TPA: CHRD domain-containing protein [Thermoleophilaceae bacterium]|jgi:hypothetical protein